MAPAKRGGLVGGGLVHACDPLLSTGDHPGDRGRFRHVGPVMPRHWDVASPAITRSFAVVRSKLGALPTPYGGSPRTNQERIMAHCEAIQGKGPSNIEIFIRLVLPRANSIRFG